MLFAGPAVLCSGRMQTRPSSLQEQPGWPCMDAVVLVLPSPARAQYKPLCNSPSGRSLLPLHFCFEQRSWAGGLPVTHPKQTVPSALLPHR